MGLVVARKGGNFLKRLLKQFPLEKHQLTGEMGKRRRTLFLLLLSENKWRAYQNSRLKVTFSDAAALETTSLWRNIIQERKGQRTDT